VDIKYHEALSIHKSVRFVPTLASASPLLKLLFVILSLGLIMPSSCWLLASLRAGDGGHQPGRAPWQRHDLTYLPG